MSELFLCLYARVQCHALRIDEYTKLLDLLGTKRRREISLGPILRSINSRSCPAAVERRSFDEIGSEAYCQICHRTGVENGVSRCGGCGVVAYCTEKHAVSPRPLRRPRSASRPSAHKRIALPAAGRREPA